MSTSTNVPGAVQACHELLAWVSPLLDQFPRNRCFTLGERIETGLLEILEHLVAAAYSRDKRELLTRANRRLSVNRHLWRLAWELRVIGMRRYEHGSRLMDDLGRQIGSWLRSRSADEAPR